MSLQTSVQDIVEDLFPVASVEHKLAVEREIYNILEGKDIGKFKGDISVFKKAAIDTAAAMPGAAKSRRSLARDSSKELDKVVDRLEATMNKYLKRLRGEGESKWSPSKFRKEMKSALSLAYTDAYRLGTRASGLVRATDLTAHTSPDEKRWIQNVFSQEQKYFNKFLDSLVKGESWTKARNRIRNYSNAVRSVYDSARTLQLPDNTVIHWVLQSSNPCPECRLLHRFSPYTKDTLPCLVGETEIFTLVGILTIEDLFNGKYPYEDIWVYSLDTETGEVVPGKVEKVVEVGESETLFVELDSGDSYEVTPDHPFLMREDLTYRRADELKPGDSIKHFNSHEDKDGYLHVEKKPGRMNRAHWLVARSLGLLKGFKVKENDKLVIHHKNFDKTDNDPANLVPMNLTDHSAYHMRHTVNKLNKDPEFIKKRNAAASKTFTQFNADPKNEEIRSYNRFLGGIGLAEYAQSVEGRAASGKHLKQLWKDPEFRRVVTERCRQLGKDYGGWEGIHGNLAERGNHAERSSKNLKNLKNLWTQEEFRSSRVADIQGYNRSLEATKLYKCKFCKRDIVGKHSRTTHENCCKWRDGDPTLHWNNRVLCDYCWRPCNGKRGLASHLRGCPKKPILCLNHKVVRVLPSGRKRVVYDLQVKDYHNFALGCGVFTHNTTPKAGSTRCLAYCFCRLRIVAAKPAAVRKVARKNKSAERFLKRLVASRKAS